MTKLGTPIGAGPKGAIVVVGLAAVGAPPLPKARAAVGAVGQRLVARRGAGGGDAAAAVAAAAAGVAEAPGCG